jgi:hypothetical protein
MSRGCLQDRSNCDVTFTRKTRHERWSAEDDELLREMSHAAKSITLMTVKLNRPYRIYQGPGRGYRHRYTRYPIGRRVSPGSLFD